MKVFISQPMKGKSDEEILSERERIKDAARSRLEKEGNSDIEFIDSYFEDYNPDNGCVPLKYLSKSLELLADADVAIFGKGWERARGCVIEHICAERYGIRIINEEPPLFVFTKIEDLIGRMINYGY